jgi:hypothetical protein
MIASSNALHPDLMTADERLDEVAAILAAGILRMRARRRRNFANRINGLEKVPLDFPAEKSVCGFEPSDSGEGR